MARIFDVDDPTELDGTGGSPSAYFSLAGRLRLANSQPSAAPAYEVREMP